MLDGKYYINSYGIWFGPQEQVLKIMAMQTKVRVNPHGEVFQERYIYFSEQYSTPSKIEKLIQCPLCFELSD